MSEEQQEKKPTIIGATLILDAGGVLDPTHLAELCAMWSDMGSEGSLPGRIRSMVFDSMNERITVNFQ